jgi:peptidoglycan L-alanyl-D-glutamate endopeptidase CwlK
VSRNIDDLKPEVAAMCRDFLAKCKSEGVDILVTCTLRTNAEQAALYAQGRTTPGLIVTNAKPGESRHNHGEAFDVVPLRNGKPVWSTSGQDGLLWSKIGAIGESCGLEWAGRWTGKLKEMAHFQNKGQK